MATQQFIDFADLKTRVSIAQCVQMLGLRMKGSDQLRSACPTCQTGGDRALAVNNTKGSFYCFAQGKGGDQIALVAHINDVGQREAAQQIAQHFRIAQPDPPKNETPKGEGGGMEALSYLEHSHEAVDVLGFDADTAKALGIGFAPRGIMKGLVCVPVRLEDGSIAGYLGLTEIAKLPPQWRIPVSNVVPIPKKTA